MEDPSQPLQQIFLIEAFGADIVISLFVLAILLMLSAIISASEVAFFGLSANDFKEIEEQKEQSEVFMKIKNLVERPKELLATILILNNFVNVGIIILSGYILNVILNFSENALLEFFVQTVIVTFLILLFGEIIPKVYANKESLKIAKLSCGLLNFMSSVLKPFNNFLIKTTSFLDNSVRYQKDIVSADQLSHAMELTVKNETTEEEQKLFKGIIKFGNTDVKQIMTPRVDTLAIEFQLTYKDVLAKIVDAGFSRIPVYKQTFDNVVGVLYTKDLLPHLNKKTFGWQKLIRAPFFVPENKKIDDLLKDFQERKIHLAVVTDEYGGTSGIVTLEDIIEEIVGEISDEFDEEELIYSKIDENNFIFEGKILLKDLYRVLNIEGENFEEKKGESDTLAGFILELTGSIPKVGEEVQFENYLFNIESADNRRIHHIKLTVFHNADAK